MSENNPDRDINESKPGKLSGLGLVAVIVATGGLGFGYYLYNDSNKVTAEQRRAGVIQAGTVGELWRPAPVAQEERPRDPEPQRPRDTGLGEQPRPRASSMMVYSRPGPTPAQERAAAQTAARETPETIAGLPVLQAASITDAHNFLMPGDEIACISNQPLTASNGAAFSALIPEDFLGRGGAWPPLIPRGSTAVGKIMRDAEDGDSRIAAVLTHIQGPVATGKPTIFVPLGDGQAAEPLGDAGLKANVETRFWARLGAVAAYAGLDAVGRIGSALAGNAISEGLSTGNTNINVGNFGGATSGRSLAGRAFDHELRRGPQLNRPQAQPCTIFIQKPIRVRGTAPQQRGR